mmetsp:Transcript_3158/g.11400  ORF Transcript_3158/g.11400 Transcript_3158/m.11400 type:complete len:251 (-) Transcript_3158:1163-1915(-)
MGRLSRCACIERLERMPKVGALPSACFFHSGISYAATPTPRSSCARCRSPPSGMGSSHGRLRSLGTLSSMERCCCSLSSRRSLASAPCVMAARCRLPSGFLTILIGETFTELRVWPLRNVGSASLSSTSKSTSFSSAARPSMPSSSSKVGYSSTDSTPDAMSCLASHSSVSDSFFPGRLRSLRSSSSGRRVRPDRPRSDWFEPGPVGLELLLAPACGRTGSRSSPVSWFTSRILRPMRWPARLMTFTQTL